MVGELRDGSWTGLAICKTVWSNTRETTRSTNCNRWLCDEVCNKKFFRWGGLSSGAIAAIVTAAGVVTP
jgi:hypothetical protein